MRFTVYLGVCLLTLTACGLLAVSGARAGAPELSKNVRVYRGDEGVRVAVAAVMPKSEGKAAIRVSGTDTALDGVVFLASVEDLGDRGANFKITWRGRAWNVLTSRESWWGGAWLELHAPEQRGRSIGYDDAESQKASSAELAIGLERDKAKVLELGKFDRPAEQQKHERSLEAAGRAVQSACGMPLVMSVDWQTVDDATLKSRNIAEFCGAPLQSLSRLCSEPKTAAIAKKVLRSATCRFGESLKLAVADGALSWQTSSKAPNQAEFARANLMNLLQ
jgi:hypothetical protein